MSASRVLRALRSRELALALLLLLAVFSLLGTLGVDFVYSSLPFYALAGLLLAATAVCAWERTRAAWRRLGRLGHVSAPVLGRLKERPGTVVRAPPTEDRSPEETMADAGRGMRALGLRVSVGPRLLEASSGRWALLGSPVFHWSLAALILFVALGQLTRAEGFVGVPIGSSVTDATESYRMLDEGPLYPGHSGLRIEATDMVLSYIDGDVDRGAAPIVSLYDGDDLVASQRVYPNNPLRHGSLLIHMNDYGLSPLVVLQGPDGRERAREAFIADYDEERPEGVEPVEFDLTSDGGASLPVVLQLVAASEDEESRIDVTITDPELGFPTKTSVGVGEPLELPGGELLIVEDVGFYARLSIADDWSVPYLYLLFALTTITVTVAVLVPHRRVLVLWHEGPGGAALHVDARHSRGSPVFAARVEGALRSAVGAEGGDTP